jgi:hypothetical protein
MCTDSHLHGCTEFTARLQRIRELQGARCPERLAQFVTGAARSRGCGRLRGESRARIELSRKTFGDPGNGRDARICSPYQGQSPTGIYLSTSNMHRVRACVRVYACVLCGLCPGAIRRVDSGLCNLCARGACTMFVSSIGDEL